MPKIPEREIERLKRELDLVKLISSYNVKLKKTGSQYIGLCPLHNDKEPSLVVSREKNLWQCKGACNTGGTTIDWIMAIEKVEFLKAVEILQSLNGSMNMSIPKSTTRVEKSPLDSQVLFNQVIDHYHETLKRTPQAMEYLQKRGIVSSEAIDKFKIGYCDRTLGSFLYPTRTKESMERKKILIDGGFIRESGYEHFTGCVVFPVIDERNYVLEVYGRKITDSRQPQHLYLPGKHKGVWNSSAFVSKEIILCESIIDAMSFWENGFRNVTASFGVAGFTDDLLDALARNRVEVVRIAYDPDQAGKEAALKLTEKLNPLGIQCFYVEFPNAQDANGFCVKMKPGSSDLKELLDSAKPIGKDFNLIDDKELKGQRKEKDNSPSFAAQGNDANSFGNASGQGQSHETVSREIESPKNLNDFHLKYGNRVYRIRGLAKNTSEEILKVNIKVHFEGNEKRSYRHTFDLFHGKNLTEFVNASAKVLDLKPDIIRNDFDELLDYAERVQSKMIRTAMEPKDSTPVISLQERNESLAFGKSENLLVDIVNDFEICGLVGERHNALFGFLSTLSRFLPKPLHVIIQSSSSTGKSTLMDAILNFVPDEHKHKYTAMTGQALFYMNEEDLKHKVIAISEDEGAEKAGYAMKILQSEGELSLAYTAKNMETGEFGMKERFLKGPTAFIKTTTNVDIDEEEKNRNAILYTDEDTMQTIAIQYWQRLMDTEQGLMIRRIKEKIIRKHHNLQRSYRFIEVINPYSLHLTFPHHLSRTRRDHMKYLTLIKAIAFLQQHQRPIQYKRIYGDIVPCIEVIPFDIRVANLLASHVFGRTMDELAPHTKTFLEKIIGYAKEECDKKSIELKNFWLDRKTIRGITGLSNSRVHTHLSRLEDLEYIISHRDKKGRLVYELMYTEASQPGTPFFPGIIPDSKLDEWEKNAQISAELSALQWSFSALKDKFSAPILPQFAPDSGGFPLFESYIKSLLNRYIQ